MIQSLMGLRNPNYSFPGYQGTLLVIPMTLICVLCNLFAGSQLPRIQNFFMFLHVASFVAVLVVLCVLAPHVDASTALLTFTNSGGWKTTGLSVMIGQISAVVALIGTSMLLLFISTVQYLITTVLPLPFDTDLPHSRAPGCDAAAHMSEEVLDAGLSVPRAMMWTFLLNATLGFIITIAFIFSIPSIDDCLNDPSGFPLIYVLNLSLSPTGTLGMFILSLILIMLGNISYQASTARQTFAFARDQGLPFSHWIGRINTRAGIPVNAILLSAVITFLLSLINIGNADAFNAIISLSAVALMGTYVISIGCLLHRRVTAPHLLPAARWNLGSAGVAVNSAALAWAGFTWFWMFWPNGE